ncbi:MAG: OmpH family outer membrane protein [Bacteroidales bacterium]|nr:OmpH family outer membrane protein [Bacteroidales bacterium]
MKRGLIFAVAMLFAALQMNAQKVGYINTEEILKAVPEYSAAQKQLESLGSQYQEKIEGEYAKIEAMYVNYQAQKANLPAQARQQRENEIISREKTVKELQQTYFGQDGLMQKKSQELLDPIKEKVDAAVGKVAQAGGYTIILDVASMQGVAYTDPAADLSGAVKRLLGY